MLSRAALLASLLAISGTAILAVSLACRAPELFELNTTSPDGTYRTQFKERVGFPRPTRHEVRFDVFKGEVGILKDEQLIEGGVYDDMFSVLYPEHAWISPSVLRFGRKDRSPEPQHDEVSIENATDRTITYLRVNAGKYETFLLFELKPRSLVTLNAQAQTDKGHDSSFIGCKGRFEDGTPIREKPGDFDIRGKYSSPAHYSVKVSDSAVLITSKEFDSLTQSAK